jgi:hypothetical protein
MGMTILKSIYNFLYDVGRYRAAGHLIQMGDYEGGCRLMSDEFKGWV